MCKIFNLVLHIIMYCTAYGTESLFSLFFIFSKYVVIDDTFWAQFFIMSYNCMQPSILDSRTIKGSQPKMSFLLCCVSGNVSCDSSRFYRADRQTKVKTLLGLPAALIFCPLSSLFCKLQTANLCWMWLWLTGGVSWSVLICCVSGNVSCDSSRFYWADS